MVAPTKTAGNGRDQAGRFTEGNPGGPGRPRRPDLYTVAAERAAAENVDLEVELWAVCKELIAQAKTGNVQAAKVLFDRLCVSGKAGSELGGMTLEELVMESLRED